MWFNNHYRCAGCGQDWSDEWSCTPDDDCPECGARHMTPFSSDDLTFVVEHSSSDFHVFQSAESAEYGPDYQLRGTFKSEHAANLYVDTLRSAVQV